MGLSTRPNPTKSNSLSRCLSVVIMFPCSKSQIWIDFFYTYWRSKNLAIRLEESILAYKLGNRLLLVAKSNDKIFQKLQKSLFFSTFWAHFALFRKSKSFPEKWTLPRLSPCGPLTSCTISRATNERIPIKKCVTGGRMNRRTNEQTDERMNRPEFIGPCRKVGVQ